MRAASPSSLVSLSLSHPSLSPPSLSLSSPLLSQPLQPTNLFYTYTQRKTLHARRVRVRVRCRCARAKLPDEALHVRHDDDDDGEDYDETIIYQSLEDTFAEDVFGESPGCRNGCRVTARVHRRPRAWCSHITNLSRRTPASRGGRGRIPGRTGKRRETRATAPTRRSGLVVSRQGGRRLARDGGGRGKGGKKRREAADRDGVDVEVITCYVNPYDAKLIREEKEGEGNAAFDRFDRWSTVLCQSG